MRLFFIAGLLFLAINIKALAQRQDSTVQLLHVKSGITVTNTGISLIPTFSLGKPAAIADLSLGKKRLYFEPQLRFALEGKPWSFIFWWRYKLVQSRKISLTAGAHPALNFRTTTFTENGVTKKGIAARRYLAGELAPNYILSKKISLGVYYLYSRCLEKDAFRNTHFLTINSHISAIPLLEKIQARFSPQVYYLKQDRYHGYYINATLTLYRHNFPLSVQTIMNKTISSNIPGSKNFVWNLSLIASFSKIYAKHG